MTQQCKCYHLILSSQVMVSEAQFTDDPAAVATLTVVRSPSGEGAVVLAWRLEEEGWRDLTPHNGTIIFDQVYENVDIAIEITFSLRRACCSLIVIFSS